jgi:hypothetical protein
VDRHTPGNSNPPLWSAFRFSWTSWRFIPHYTPRALFHALSAHRVVPFRVCHLRLPVLYFYSLSLHVVFNMQQIKFNTPLQHAIPTPRYWDNQKPDTCFWCRYSLRLLPFQGLIRIEFDLHRPFTFLNVISSQELMTSGTSRYLLDMNNSSSNSQKKADKKSLSLLGFLTLSSAPI